MGRHSAPDEHEDGGVAALAVEYDVVPRGRHSRTEDAESTGPVGTTRTRDPRRTTPAALQDEQPTERIGLLEELTEDPDPPTVEFARPPAAPTELGESGARPEGPTRPPPETTATERPASTSATKSGIRSRLTLRAKPGTTPEPGTPSATEAEPATAGRADTAAAGTQRPSRAARSTAADLALLRSRSDLRARCIAAVAVPLVVYAAVLVIVGGSHVQYLLWLWAPLVFGLALAGNFLDIAHRQETRRAQAAAAEHPTEPTP